MNLSLPSSTNFHFFKELSSSAPAGWSKLPAMPIGKLPAMPIESNVENASSFFGSFAAMPLSIDASVRLMECALLSCLLSCFLIFVANVIDDRHCCYLWLSLGELLVILIVAIAITVVTAVLFLL